MKKVLVTGSTGFVGKELVKLLNSKNFFVKTLSSSNNKDKNHLKIDVLVDDIPPTFLQGIDTIFHLIGLSHDIHKTGNYKKYHSINFEFTKKLALLAKASNVRRFIYLSTTKAIGSSFSKSEISEDTQLVPKDIYGKTKRMAEVYLLNLALESNMEIIILRSPLIYGINIKGNLLELINSIKKNKFPPINVKNKRSMISVSDISRALLLLDKIPKEKRSIYLATDKIIYSTSDIINSIKREYKKRIYEFYIPKIVFLLISYVGNLISLFINSSFDKKKYEKIFENEYYSSDNIIKLGFNPEKTFYSEIKSIIKSIENDKKNI